MCKKEKSELMERPIIHMGKNMGLYWDVTGSRTRMNAQDGTWPESKVLKPGVRIMALIYMVIGPHFGDLS